MTPTPSLRLGLLGGTLDPVHHGHIAAAQAARDALQLDVVWLVPARIPAQRAVPSASTWHRFAMAAMAVDGQHGLAVSDVELARTGTTYTWDTLEDLTRDGFVPSQLFFITGADAFERIATWHRYPALLDRAHFVVVTRPGHPVALGPACPREVHERLRPAGPGADIACAEASATSVWTVEAETPDISSSRVRTTLRQGGDVDACLAPAVIAHIRRHGLYDIPSSARTLHGKH